MRLAESITTKNITSVDEVQSVDNTDKVFVNDNGSFKQISVSNLMKQAPSGVTEETDPTVSEWAKQPTKPSYTADEVGALPVGTKIPTKTSDLTNDSGYLTQIPEEYVTETELGRKGYVVEDDIPEKLPSPGILTFTGAVNDTYDGSVNKTINIPTGGGEGGTSDYNALANKPKLNGVEIAGNKTSTDYKIVSSEQGIENNGKFLGVGVDGNVTPVDKPTYTADEVGARPDTWTPSAEDVGALPNNTEIPSKTSDLENDSGFITNSDIPEKLPNPQKIIFTGAVTAEYDGSSQQTINIPTGGGSDPYTLPIMSDTRLGGGKAVEKTDEDVPVAVDPSTGQLFVPTYPENTGGGGGSVDPEQIKQAVNGYLEENPVSGMTAEQEQQLNQNTSDVSDLKSAINEKVNKSGWTPGKYLGTDSDGNIVVKNAPDDSGGSTEISSQNLIDPSQYTNSGYAGDLFTQFGSSINVFAKEIDTSETKTFYYRVYRNNQVYNHAIGLKVGCYDSSGEWLYTMYDLDGDYTENFESYVRESGTNSEPLETVDDHNVIVKNIGVLTIPSEVSKIKIGIPGNSAMINVFYPAFAISDEKITNFGSITNEDYSLIQGASDSEEGVASNKPLLNKLLGMMGDSLTNWGGGNDTQDGFLKIIHDRTGISTVNLGLAGATWEEADGQTQPGVTRVDTYVSGAVRYDCIAFLLGTNVANQGEVTDTSDTKTTMCGAIKYCLEQLITLSPTTPIIVFLPPQRAEGNTEQKARNDIIKQICEIYGVYTFDLYTRSQVIPNTTVTGNGTLSDGLHLSKKGQENFGRIMSTAILNVMGYY